MLNSSIGGYDLPAQTKYVINKPKRSEYQPTYTGGQFDDKGELITEDFSLSVTIPDTTRIVYEALLSRYDSSASYVFVGHLDTTDDTWSVKMESLDFDVDGGMYQIKMELKVVT